VPGQAKWYIREWFGPWATMSASPLDRKKDRRGGKWHPAPGDYGSGPGAARRGIVVHQGVARKSRNHPAGHWAPATRDQVVAGSRRIAIIARCDAMEGGGCRLGSV
jgi:hypothetical protein